MVHKLRSNLSIKVFAISKTPPSPQIIIHQNHFHVHSNHKLPKTAYIHHIFPPPFPPLPPPPPSHRPQRSIKRFHPSQDVYADSIRGIHEAFRHATRKLGVFPRGTSRCRIDRSSTAHGTFESRGLLLLLLPPPSPTQHTITQRVYLLPGAAGSSSQGNDPPTASTSTGSRPHRDYRSRPTLCAALRSGASGDALGHAH